jgi:hypothetical protein
MRASELIALYATIGVTCAIAIGRRDRASGAPLARVAWSTALALAAWPLWAPVAWSAARETERTDEGPRAEALAAVRAAAAGTELERLFTRATAARLAEEIARVEARLAALTAAGDDAALARAETTLRALETSGASPRVLASARVHVESLGRLAALRRATAAALDDLDALLEALRAQLLVARFEGSGEASVEALVAELWARLEGVAGAQQVGGE